MHLLNHSISNFRNIEAIRFIPDRGVNVVFGQNGQGKTNLLESIFLLTGAKSFRTKKDVDFIRQGEEKCLIESKFFLNSRDQHIRMIISSKGRIAEKNRGGEKRASSLAGIFCCVLFSAESLLLVKGGPQQRRSFIDFALCQISPKYLIEIKNYSRVLSQKNSLLRDVYRIPGVYDMLDVYDRQLAETARVITKMRKSFCENLLSLAEHDYLAISGNREQINLTYSSTIWEDDKISFEQGIDKITRLRDTDVRAGFSTAGPHRDDLLITIDGNDARGFASQGQQRSIVLALKLAEASLMERSLGEKPLLLLDDVLSELDGNRQDFLLERLTDCQTVITGCDPLLVSKRIDASVFEMREGRLLS